MRPLASTASTAVFGLFGLVLGLFPAGCQVLTTSYSLDSMGPNCTILSLCCSSLSGTEAAECHDAVTSASEMLCSEILAGVPAGVCTTTVGSGGGASFIAVPDAEASGHDASVVVDAGSTANLTGTWTLAQETCDGQELSTEVSSTVSFSTGLLKQVDDFGDGCIVTTTRQPVTISSTTISATGGSVECGSECTLDDDCASGAADPATFTYTLSSGTLQISEGVNTTTCASGTAVFSFEMAS